MRGNSNRWRLGFAERNRSPGGDRLFHRHGRFGNFYKLFEWDRRTSAAADGRQGKIDFALMSLVPPRPGTLDLSVASQLKRRKIGDPTYSAFAEHLKLL